MLQVLSILSLPNQSYSVATDSANYEGCFRENKRFRHFSMSPGNYDPSNLTPMVCQNVCGKWRKQFSGLTTGSVGSICFCADSAPAAFNLEGDNWCSEECSGDAAERCGSFDHVSVLRSALPVEGLKVTTTDSDKIVTIFTEVDFDYEITSGPSNLLYSFNYGGVDDAFTDQNVTGMEVKEFSVPGEHDVILSAQDVDGASDPEYIAIKILAQAEVKGVDFLCPEHVATFEEFSANATIHSGSFMHADLNWMDASPHDSFNIADAVFYTTGGVIPSAVIDPTDFVHESGNHVMWDREFLYDGYLHAIEGIASVSGSIDIFVMAPTCAGYCHETRSCTACSNDNYATQTCSSGESFCGAQGACVNDGTDVCGAGWDSRYGGGYAALTGGYTTVYTITVTLGAVGYFKHIIPDGEEYAISPGSVLGFNHAAGGILFGIPVGSENPEWITGTASNAANRHNLRAIYSRRSTVMFYHEYTEIGIYNLQLNITAEYLPDSFESATCTVEALEGINFTIIDSPEFSGTGWNTIFTLVNQSGNNKTHIWDFGDGNSVTSDEDYVTHMYTTAGEYNITCDSSNSISAKDNYTSIIIEDPLVNVAISPSPLPAAVTTEQHDFYFSADSGSSYTCDWVFNSDAPITMDENELPIDGGTSVPYTFSTPGNTSSITVTCRNNVTTDSDSLINFLVEDRIEGLELDPTGTLLNLAYSIDFVLTAGSNPIFEIMVDGGSTEPYTYNPDTLSGETVQEWPANTVRYFPVSINATNAVSHEYILVNFTIDELIQGAESNLLPTPSDGGYFEVDGVNFYGIRTGQTIHFDAGAISGTSIQITWDYMDGTTPDEHQEPLTGAWPGGLQTRTHVFNTPGEYNVTVTVQNNFDEYPFFHLVHVYSPIENLTLHSNSPQPFLYNERADLNFHFTVDGDPPTAARVVFDWGDGTRSEPEDFRLDGAPYQYTYTEVVSVNVTANVSHLLDWALFSTPVISIVPVTNLQITCDPAHASVNQPVSANIGMDSGNDVELEIYFGSSDTTDDRAHGTWPRTSTNAWGYDTATHTYTATGNYTITVIASNMLGNTTLYYIIAVQEPVTNDFELTTDAPQNYLGGVTTLTFTISLPAFVTMPSSPQYRFDYGDGTQSDWTTLEFPQGACPCTLVLTHDFEDPGDFTTTLYIGNLATDPPLSFNYTAGIYEDISPLSVEMQWREPGGPLLDGLLTNQEYFRFSHDVIFNVTAAAGTIVSYTIDYTETNSGDTGTMEFEENPFSVRFPEVGEYNVTITAANSLHDEQVTESLFVSHSPHGLTISDYDTVTDQNENKGFLLAFEDISDETCVLIDWGDSTWSLYTTTGDVTICDGYSVLDPFPVTSVAGPVALNMTLSHNYTSRDTFTMNVKAVNNLAFVEESFTFPVSDINCNTPAITIADHTDILEAMSFYKSLSFYVTSQVTLRCGVTLSNTKRWVIEKVDTMGNVLETINTETMPSRDFAELFIPIRFLSYGIYRFTLTVTMNPSYTQGLTFRTIVSTYREIVPSPLVALLAHSGMGIITRGNDQYVVIEPGEYSRDPDVDPSEPQGIESFRWHCREFNEDPNWNHLTRPRDRDSIDFASENGGCFREGPGIIADPNVQGSMVELERPSLNFSSLNMRENHTYIFNVTVYKDTRQSWTTLQLRILAGEPPVFKIDCSNDGFCQTTTNGLRVNPTGRVAIRAICDENCGDVTYQWTMYRQGLSDSWIEVDDFEEYVNDLYSAEIAISPRLFEEGYELYAHMDVYRVKLTATRFGASGEAFTIVSLNRKPEDGYCDIQPRHGVVSQTNWTLICEGWRDDDSIAKYQYLAIFEGDDVIRTLHFGSGNNVTLDLPLGAYWDDYNMTIILRVYDSLSAYAEISIDDVQVSPIPVAQGEEMVNELLSEDNDDIANVIAGGDFQGANTQFQRYASVLNSMSIASQNAYAGSEILDDINNENGYGPFYYNTRTTGATGTQNDTTSFQTARSDRATLRQEMLVGISDMPVSTVADAILMTTTLGELTQQTAEVTRTAQKAVLQSTGNMVDLISEASGQITLEELQSATTNIFSVIGQIFESANIAAREPVNSDIEEAVESPFYYYDADYNSPRESLADLTAAEQEEALARESNSYLQKDEMKAMVPNAEGMVNRMFAAVTDALVAGEPSISMNTSKISATVTKDDASRVTNATIRHGRSSVRLPTWCDLQGSDNCNDTTAVAVSTFATPMNSYTQTENSQNVPYSSATVGCTIRSDTGQELEIRNTAAPIQIRIPQRIEDIVTETHSVEIPDRSRLFYHCLDVENSDASVHVKLTPNDGQQYIVMGSFGDFPRIRGKDKSWDFWGLSPSNQVLYANLSSENATEMEINPFVITADNTVVNNHTGQVCIGVSPVNEENEDAYDENNPPVAQSEGMTGNYTVSMWTSGCYFYNTNENKWLSYGCVVQPETKTTETVCACSHLTSFGGGFAVAPNAIDFDYVFANAEFTDNLTIYITQIIVVLVYICVAVWARRADKKDVAKLGVTPLKDNDMRDKYLYEVQVSTGSRKNAATDSNVHFIMSGDYDETDVRTFEDDKRKIFRRGAVDNFLLAHSGPLGPIQFLRVWHDNSGKGKFQGWYCRSIIVHDLQTKEKYFFLVQNWLAVEESDGQIDRTIPVAGPENMVEFQHLFSKTTRKNLNDEHIWFSVVTRPPQSRFSRLERLSCCLCLLYTSMLANAMYYGVDTDGAGQNALTVGPFALTTQQLFIGVITNLIVFPVNFLLVAIFRRSRPRHKRPSRINEALKQNGYDLSATTTTSSATDSDKKRLVDELEAQPVDADSRCSTPKISPAQPLKPAHSPNSHSPTTALSIDAVEEGLPPKEEAKKVKKPTSFPWYCKIFGWILLWITVGISFAFVTFYAIQMGDMATKKWITSLLISFITSIFFTQPIKVFLTALLFSILFKKVDFDEEGDEDEEEIKLKQDESWLHQHPTVDGYIPPTRTEKLGFNPPDPETLARARDYRMKEVKMYDILREILFYSFFLWILLVISYGFRDPNAYFLKGHMDNLLVDEGLGKVNKISNPYNDFRKVNTYDHFYAWLQDILIPNLRAEPWYNGEQPIGQRGFIGDRYGRLMGYATLRQLRIRKDLCSVEKSVHKYLVDLECNKPYSTWNEDTDDYGVGWERIEENATYSNSKPEYLYKTAEELDSYPFWANHAMYSGGGYVVELKGSKRAIMQKIEEIIQDSWTDRWTRAIFVEFTVYNPNVNLFGVVTMVAEVLNSGGLATFQRFEPMNLLGYYQKSYAFQVGCEIAFLCFIVFFIVKEARNMYKQRKEYFKQFWNWIELCIIVNSISCVVIYFYRVYHANKLTKRFEETHGNGYMKFQYTGYWNEILLYCIGILCFLATIKFIKLLRFNRRMGMLAATLRYGAKPLFWFGIIFMIMFLAYAQFFYLIYFIEVQNFKTMVHSIETLLQMLVGKFNFSAMQAADPVMGPLIFFFYVVTVYYILLNMFLTILNESFARVREDITLQTNDYEMVDFIMSKFKQWTGIKSFLGMNKDKKKEAENSETVEKQLEQFPERVDRLLDVLCRAYLNSGQFDAMMNSNLADKKAMKEMLRTEEGEPEMSKQEQVNAILEGRR